MNIYISSFCPPDGGREGGGVTLKFFKDIVNRKIHYIFHIIIIIIHKKYDISINKRCNILANILTS